MTGGIYAWSETTLEPLDETARSVSLGLPQCASRQIQNEHLGIAREAGYACPRVIVAFVNAAAEATLGKPRAVLGGQHEDPHASPARPASSGMLQDLVARPVPR